MNLRVVSALLLRYLFLFTRNWVRVAEVIFWPMMELLLWGFLQRYLESEGADRPGGFAFLIGGMIFWDVMFRAQQAVAISFLEDVWTRNLLNVFVAPVRPAEYLAAAFGIGFVRIGVTVALLAVLSWIQFQFNLFALKSSLIPFFANLLLFGWSMGIFATALIMRWGQAAESLAWAVPVLIQPMCAAFYPVSVLPAWFQPVSLSLPCTHVFEGMRGVLAGQPFSWPHFWWSVVLNFVFLALAATFYARVLRTVRERGLLSKFATS
jgi:ABC-2 type transport system permease protein